MIISSKLIKILIHMILIFIGLIWIFPFIWMILGSLKTNTEFMISGNPIPDGFNWENYSRAWIDANFSAYFLNTVIMTVATVIIVVFLCSLTGYALGRVDFPGKKTILGIVVGIMFIPKGYTIIPLYELVDQLGLTNSLFGIILAESSGAHTLFVLLFTSYFATLPKEMEEAAIMDGCGFVKTFFKVMLPLAKPIMATTVIMQFIWTWSSFLIPTVLTISKPELRTLAVGMQNFVGQYSTDWAGMAAGATISLLPVLIVFILMQRYFIEGVAGAVKQ
ncbi:raffinose/stachyose/melibiose transport system permease protein [Gracilibacillus orientalis]|uniref:Raffinose/stachyose/melibiose transport system permease protein n=1 Tax=Gracilibacillus orientalis TaxID=334253 RepID=A0A1I4IBX7_9BACI|nr:carbohydrate ABC transporter permease [Gracilibacillus orientalis]SFL51882.1 raffinose/stachyose/melibiose transport system permease protein [Gracilibacillus orientalis]